MLTLKIELQQLQRCNTNSFVSLQEYCNLQSRLYNYTYNYKLYVFNSFSYKNILSIVKFFVTLQHHSRWNCNVGFGSANSNKFGLHSLLHHICHRENQARFLQPLGVTKIPLKGNKKRDRPTPLPLPLRRGATAKIGSASTKPKASFCSVFGLRDLCVTAKIGSASTKPKRAFALCSAYTIFDILIQHGPLRTPPPLKTSIFLSNSHHALGEAALGDEIYL